VGTAGHLHPGGLWTDLKLTRDGRTVRLFRSKARYFEPAGAVSWDVAMTVTPQGWRVGVRKGDVLSVSGTYDTRRASWYESMAIMPTLFAPGATGPDPFTTDVDVPGVVTHGHLRENDNHGGGRFSGLPNPLRMLALAPPRHGIVAINDFLYGQGDFNKAGRRGRPALTRRGRGLEFVNRDAARGIFHTITACKAPCNRTTGIAYPLANGPVDFDSGQLGFGPAGFTAAANRDTWTTPRNLRAGTYTYFCRVHPFMRGAFEVKRKRR
jgi:plastocyanin